MASLWLTTELMHYVYILRSKSDLSRHYVGYTADLKRRIKEHHSATQGFTAECGDWELHWYCAFQDETAARAFEKYLKSGSGRAFSKRHL